MSLRPGREEPVRETGRSLRVLEDESESRRARGVDRDVVLRDESVDVPRAPVDLEFLLLDVGRPEERRVSLLDEVVLLDDVVDRRELEREGLDALAWVVRRGREELSRIMLLK